MQLSNFIKQFLSASLFFLMFTSFNNRNEKKVLDFELNNVNGKTVSLKNYPTAKGFIIVFTCNHCPFAKLYPERLNTLNAYFGELNVPLIAISSTDTVAYPEDAFEEMKEKAINEKFNFPYLADGTQRVAKNYKADKTPHAFVIWKEEGEWVIKYSGAIDDNGMEPEKVKNKYVEDAVKDLLAHKPVRIKETKSVGCQIYFRK